MSKNRWSGEKHPLHLFFADSLKMSESLSGDQEFNGVRTGRRTINGRQINTTKKSLQMQVFTMSPYTCLPYVCALQMPAGKGL